MLLSIPFNGAAYVREARMRRGHYLIVGLLGLTSLSFFADHLAGLEAGRGFDYYRYEAVLRRFVDDQGRVDYRLLRENREQLDVFVKSLADFPPRYYYRWPEADRIALWINASNAHVLQVVIDNYPIKPTAAGAGFPKNSIRQIGGALDGNPMVVMGSKMTVQGLVRHMREQFGEPRVHFALAPAALGGPPLRREPYTGAKLNEQLEQQAALFLANPANFRIEAERKTVVLSAVFKELGGDFAGRHGTDSVFTRHNRNERAVLSFISCHVSPQESRYLVSGDYVVRYAEYDWRLNVQSGGTGTRQQFR